MSKVVPGRWSARPEGEFVLFLIGMRINKPLKVHRWLPVAVAMPRMLRELERNPQDGLLHAQFAFIDSSPAVVEYWRSFEQLETYARNPNALHLPAWKRFNAAVRDNGDVGIWHETYRIDSDRCEAIYGNMPRWGLAEAFDHVSVGTTSQAAAARIGARPDAEPELEPY